MKDKIAMMVMDKAIKARRGKKKDKKKPFVKGPKKEEQQEQYREVQTG